MKLAIILHTLPLVLGILRLYITSPLGLQDYMSVTSDGGDKAPPPVPDNSSHPETCPNDKSEYMLADNVVCGDRPRFSGQTYIEFDYPTTKTQSLAIGMPEYTLAVSCFS
jgi:hypothetical protein